jgi:hypothetical protein
LIDWNSLNKYFSSVYMYTYVRAESCFSYIIYERHDVRCCFVVVSLNGFFWFYSSDGQERNWRTFCFLYINEKERRERLLVIKVGGPSSYS